MKETIKGKEVIAYKGMESNMTCIDFQYEIGKSYKTDKAELCECGFHACLNPRDVLGYYPQYKSSRYFKVKLSGVFTKCDKYHTNVAATEITILEEITDVFNEVIENTEWWKNDGVLDLLCHSAGFAILQRGDGLYNYIDKKGNILSDEWFYHVYKFHKGFAVVERGDGLYNHIDKKGNILSKEWFNDVDDFHDGFAIVQRSDRFYNYIDKQGNILSKEWFKWTDNFRDGFAKVQRSDKLYNHIDKNGNYLSDEWFKWVDNFYEGFAKVQRTNGEWWEIDKAGKLYED